jgi:hypothetical protein
VQEAAEPGLKTGQACPLGLALPSHQDAPTGVPQGALDPFVPGRVSLQLLDPVGPARGGNAAAATTVHVPEAAADEDDLAQTREDEIRIAGQDSLVARCARCSKSDASRIDHHNPRRETHQGREVCGVEREQVRHTMNVAYGHQPGIVHSLTDDA